MSNHVHAAVSSPALTKTIGEFKSFTAKRVLRVLHADGARTLVWQLTRGASPKSPHRVRHLWRPGSHPEQIISEDMMRQKLDYIHENPVRRGYVDDPLHWRYSSARNYAGLEGLIPVKTDW
jgi:REP element-mobilizing transposase RayT